MNYAVELSHRAVRDLDRLDRPTRKRVLDRLEELGEEPYDPRISGPLRGIADLRKSRVGGWRLIYQINDERKLISAVMIERRGQVYKRI